MGGADHTPVKGRKPGAVRNVIVVVGGGVGGVDDNRRDVHAVAVVTKQRWRWRWR